MTSDHPLVPAKAVFSSRWSLVRGLHCVTIYGPHYVICMSKHSQYNSPGLAQYHSYFRSNNTWRERRRDGEMSFKQHCWVSRECIAASRKANFVLQRNSTYDCDPERSRSRSNRPIYKSERNHQPAQCTFLWKSLQIIGFRRLTKVIFREPCMMQSYPLLTVTLHLQRNKQLANSRQQCEAHGDAKKRRARSQSCLRPIYVASLHWRKMCEEVVDALRRSS